MDIKDKKLDKYDIKRIQDEKTKAPNSVSVGVTWVDGKLLWKHTSNLSKFFYAICHFSEAIWAITPNDFIKPTLITTILVSPPDDYCEKSHCCLDKECPLNKFNAAVFEAEYNDADPEFVKSVCKAFSSDKTLWMNEKSDRQIWKTFKIPGCGGTLKFDEEKGKSLGIGG